MAERRIVADQNEIERKRVGGDLHIEWREELAASLQIRAQFSKSSCHSSVERHDISVAQEFFDDHGPSS